MTVGQASPGTIEPESCATSVEVEGEALIWLDSADPDSTPLTIDLAAARR